MDDQNTPSEPTTDAPAPPLADSPESAPAAAGTDGSHGIVRGGYDEGGEYSVKVMLWMAIRHKI